MQVFLVQKKNEPSYDIILLGIKANISNTLIVKNLLELPQPHSETFGITQKSCSKLVTTSYNFLTDFIDLQEK